MSFAYRSVDIACEGVADQRGARGIAGIRPYFQPVRLMVTLDTEEPERRIAMLRRNVGQRCPSAQPVHRSGRRSRTDPAGRTTAEIRKTFAIARRTLLAGATAATATSARAQAWPTRAVTLLAFAGAGSTSDVLLRLLGEGLGPDLGVPIVVDNKPGANGTIAMETVLRAPADGHLLTVISQGTHNFNKVIYPNISDDPLRDVAPLIPLIAAPNALLVHPASAYRTPQDIARAARAAPGTITFASGGNGTSHHLSGGLMAQMSGTRMVHVPYRTAGQGMTAVMTREVDFAFFNIATAIGPRDAGQVRLIAVSSARRSGLLPDVATMAEAGFPGYDMSTWVGLAYRAGVPSAVMQRMHAAVVSAMADPTMRAALTRLGVDPMEPMTPEAFAAFIAADVQKWHPILRAAGIGAN